jgi:hypothetical protein
MEKRPRRHSLFWPTLLVGVGLIWLLSNLGYIQPFSVGSVLRLWPILLIIMGVDILFSRQYPWVGAVVGLLAIVGVIGFLLVSPKLGITPTNSVKTESFSTGSAGVKTVEYDFDTSSAPVYISSLKSTSNDLLQARITHNGTMRFEVSGTSNKTVSLSQYSDTSSWFTWDFSYDNYKWDIALGPKVPTSIVLNGGSGSLDMDLRGVNLTSLRTDFGSGSSDITLPESETPYKGEIEGGSGSVNMELPANTSLTLTLNTASGSTNVNIPHDAAFRIEVMDDGSGSFNLPSGLKKSTDSNNFSIGAWETPNYQTADHKILIQVLGQGSGSISIQ